MAGGVVHAGSRCDDERMRKSAACVILKRRGAPMQDADESFEVLATILQRMRGVLLRPPDDVTRILVPCRDVHTFGMKALLDIAFVGANGTILEVHRAVGPSRRLRCRRAVMVAERFSREGAWLEAGQRMVLRPNARTRVLKKPRSM